MIVVPPFGTTPDSAPTTSHPAAGAQPGTQSSTSYADQHPSGATASGAPSYTDAAASDDGSRTSTLRRVGLPIALVAAGLVGGAGVTGVAIAGTTGSSQEQPDSGQFGGHQAGPQGMGGNGSAGDLPQVPGQDGGSSDGSSGIQLPPGTGSGDPDGPGSQGVPGRTTSQGGSKVPGLGGQMQGPPLPHGTTGASGGTAVSPGGAI